MKPISLKKRSDLRRQQNQDLIRRMRSGEPLTSFDSKSSWYPPRPTIAKDANEISRLYRDRSEQNDQERDPESDLGEVS